ncbi:MAG: carboxypeptidase regulatory-like domain-containing protein, partial [Candidatus Scalindua sp.]|nr:carboxypeptidase regulatory-like domain-containing protein [Candidatus Scalindua sp.]
MRRQSNITILLILFMFIAGSSLFQDVHGQVRKSKMVVHALKDGRGLAGVTVTFKNNNTGRTGTRKTDGSGKCSDYFGIPGIGYVVTAKKTGYKFDASPMKFILSAKTKNIYFKTVAKPVVRKSKAVTKKSKMVVHALKDGH